MEDWKKRLIEEQRDLDEKISILEAFTRSVEFTKLSVRNANLLKRQKTKMREYSHILSDRIFDGDF